MKLELSEAELLLILKAVALMHIKNKKEEETLAMLLPRIWKEAKHVQEN